MTNGELQNILMLYDEECEVYIDFGDKPREPLMDVFDEVPEPLSMFDEPERIIILSYRHDS
jgi:hypothetical protein